MTPNNVGRARANGRYRARHQAEPRRRPSAVGLQDRGRAPALDMSRLGSRRSGLPGRAPEESQVVDLGANRIIGLSRTSKNTGRFTRFWRNLRYVPPPQRPGRRPGPIRGGPTSRLDLESNLERCRPRTESWGEVSPDRREARPKGRNRRTNHGRRAHLRHH